MTKRNELYEKYDQLLPAKFEGGYLIVVLYNKIKNDELAEQFTINDIRNTLEEISISHGEAIPQTERILKILLHYYIRNSAEKPGKYYLTDRARKLIEFLQNILENPYKNFPLKESFEKSFAISSDEIQTISDLERKFGRLFIEGPKKIISDHLEGLDDELIDGYAELNKILESNEKSVTTLVNQFTVAFRKFGERAEDITNSIASKDKFLKDLNIIVELFYSKLDSLKHPEEQNEFELLNQLKDEYGKAKEIYLDIENFFSAVDDKLTIIRHRIHNASDKLSELHEQFTVRAHLRLQIKRLLKITLDNASYLNTEIHFKQSYPLKNIIYENSIFRYPGHYDFNITQPNKVIRIPNDEKYRDEEYLKIIQENKRQATINEWVQKAGKIIDEYGSLDLRDLMENITMEEKDFSIAYQVTGELENEISVNENILIHFEKELVNIKSTDLSIWKTKIMKK